MSDLTNRIHSGLRAQLRREAESDNNRIQVKPHGMSDEEWARVCEERGLVPHRIDFNRRQRRARIAQMRRQKR